MSISSTPERPPIPPYHLDKDTIFPICRTTIINKSFHVSPIVLAIFEVFVLVLTVTTSHINKTSLPALFQAVQPPFRHMNKVVGMPMVAQKVAGILKQDGLLLYAKFRIFVFFSLAGFIIVVMRFRPQCLFGPRGDYAKLRSLAIPLHLHGKAGGYRGRMEQNVCYFSTTCFISWSFRGFTASFESLNYLILDFRLHETFLDCGKSRFGNTTPSSYSCTHTNNIFDIIAPANNDFVKNKYIGDRTLNRDFTNEVLTVIRVIRYLTTPFPLHPETGEIEFTPEFIIVDPPAMMATDAGTPEERKENYTTIRYAETRNEKIEKIKTRCYIILSERVITTIVQTWGDIDPKLAEAIAALDPIYAPFIEPNGTVVVRLHRALYGCIESSKLWFEHISKSLARLGYTF
eukprot:gene5450-10953_t